MYNDLINNEVQQQLPYSKLHLAYYFMNGWFKNSTAFAVIVDMAVFCITVMLVVFFFASLIEMIIPSIMGGFRLVKVDPLKDLKFITVPTKNHITLNSLYVKVPPTIEVPAHNLAREGIFRIIEIRKIGKIYSVKEYCIFDILSFVDDIEETGEILSDYDRFLSYCRPVKTLYISAKLDKHLYITPKYRKGVSTPMPYPDLRRMPVDEKLKYLSNMISKSLILIRARSPDTGIINSSYFLPINKLTSIRLFKEMIDECYSSTI